MSDPSLEQLLADVLKELQELQHPAFSATLLDGLRKAVLRQESTSADLIKLLRDLHHDLMWLRKHVAELHQRLAELYQRLGVRRPSEAGE